jgi:hypothetical protein
MIIQMAHNNQDCHITTRNNSLSQYNQDFCRKILSPTQVLTGEAENIVKKKIEIS